MVICEHVQDYLRKSYFVGLFCHAMLVLPCHDKMKKNSCSDINKFEFERKKHSKCSIEEFEF